MPNPYTGSAITGCNSPAVGADKDTYTTTFDQTVQKIDEHDHTSAKGNQIPTGGIADLAVTTAKLAAGSVTPAKKAALGAQFSSEIGFETSGAGSTDTPGTAESVTNGSVAITSTGRPVKVGLLGYGASVVEHGLYPFCPTADGSFTFLTYVFLFRNGTLIERWLISAAHNIAYPVNILDYEDHSAPAGVNTYTLKAGVEIALNTVGIFGCRLRAYEL